MKIEIKRDKVRIKKEFYTNIHEEKDIIEVFEVREVKRV